jgi:hypothetical protein
MTAGPVRRRRFRAEALLSLRRSEPVGVELARGDRRGRSGRDDGHPGRGETAHEGPAMELPV